jgi:hypothetical protein
MTNSCTGKKDFVNLSILLTGFIQVYFVAINTYFIAQAFYAGVFVASFLISIFWSYNVKRISLTGIKTRIIYSIGASFGAVAGLLTSKLFI